MANIAGKVGGFFRDPAGVTSRELGKWDPMKKKSLSEFRPGPIQKPQDVKVQAPQFTMAPSQVQQAQIAMGPQKEFRAGQEQLISALQSQAAGQGPSLAGEQLRSGMEQSILAQQAALAGARGGAQPGLARQVLQQGAQQQAGLAQQAAQARMQEQIAAQQQLAGVLQQARGGDIGLATTQAQLGQEALSQQAQLAQQAQMQMNALNAQMAALQVQAAQGNQQAAIELEKLKQQGFLGAKGLQTQQQAAGQQFAGGLVSGLAEAGATAFASDSRLKTDIKNASKDLREFMAAARGHKYKYKNEMHGKGSQYSPMAQDLEKTKIGKSMVVKDNKGIRYVDYGKGFGAMVSAMNDLHTRLQKIESKGKK